MSGFNCLNFNDLDFVVCLYDKRSIVFYYFVVLIFQFFSIDFVLYEKDVYVVYKMSVIVYFIVGYVILVIQEQELM